MTRTEGIDDELKIRDVLDFIEKEIVFLLISNAPFHIIVERIWLHQIAVTVHFEIDDDDVIFGDAFCTNFIDNLQHQRRLPRSSDARDDFDELGIVKRTDAAKIKFAKYHDSSPLIS